MGQRGTTADVAGLGVTTEFEPDVMEVLVATVRRAVRGEAAFAGTDTLLAELVMGDSEAGAVIAPGMRKSGGLSGFIQARAGLGWVSEDEAGGGPGARSDEVEVEAAWREAWWRFGLGVRGSARDGVPAVPPVMSGAMRSCLLRALASARAEGTVSVRCRHVARALLELPDSRAREALLLRRLDAAEALDRLERLDAEVAGSGAASERPVSYGVLLLRRAGTVGRSGNRLSRAFTSWTAQSGLNGSPVLFAVNVEATRQAVRCGRGTAEPVDLLLGTLALDRALAVAGHVLPEGLAAANAASAVLRRHGVRQGALVASAVASVPAVPANPAVSAVPANPAVSADGGADRAEGERARLSVAAERAVAVARLRAAERGSPTVGTVHLLSALLDDAGVAELLAAEQAGVDALRGELDGLPGA
ncbi:Clp protease N-terminal domain-containing protein [Streptomyces sp. OM5714]|uniref:Clp protease N-terminal domain-containing protein n=1 Tax=Streptomyces sp. OM5714 TaxID=2602736 RepID=UPI0013DA3DF1|nr:Clp protease N-terminal domain-containing protein [Streptomyces sp. OM5714]